MKKMLKNPRNSGANNQSDHRERQHMPAFQLLGRQRKAGL
jgi:hypothetical protein